MKLLIASCLCLGAASGLAAQTINFTITGTIGTKLSGTDPLGLAGSPYIVTTAVSAVGKPFATGSETYTGLTVNITATPALLGQPTMLTCTGAQSTVSVGSTDSIALSNCNISLAGITGSFTATSNYAANTPGFVSPIPLAFTAPSMLTSSTASYTVGTATTTFDISGSTTATCSGCSPLSLTPSSVTLTGQTGGTPQTQTVTVGTSSPLLPYALVTSGASWLSVSAPGGQTGGTFTVTATPGSLAAGTYSGSVLVYTAASNSPVTLPVTFTVGSPSFTLNASPSPMTFNVVAGGTTPAQSLTVTTIPASSVPYTASASSTGNWLSLNSTSGTTGGTPLTVSVNAAGLAAGTYTGTILLTATGATNSPLTVTVTLNVTAPSMVAAPTSLSFASMGGAVPSSQTIGLTSSVPASPISYTVAASTTSGGSWLTISPGSGTTPGTETVSISSSVLSGLATGVYSGSVVFTATTSASPTTVTVPVTLTVTATLTPAPNALTFNYTIAGTVPGAQSVGVSSNAGAITYTATAATTSGGNWLAVTPSSATTPNGVSVSVIPGSLTAGTYNGSITLTSAGASNSPVTIPVTFMVAAEPTLAVTPSTLTFNLTSNGSLPAAQTLGVSASNNGAFPFTATASTTSGGSWLSVTPGGTTPGNLTVSVLLNNLAPGIYAGSVKITVASGISNSPVTVPVELNVTAAPTLSASPASLSFAYTLLSGTNPPSQMTSITASGGAAIPITATVATGGSWLSVTPGSGTTPASLTVSVSTTGLTAGVYSGSISVTSTQASGPLSIQVTFTVTAAPTLSASVSSLTYAFQIGGSNPTPQTFMVSSSGAALSFTATATTTTGGNWLSVTPASGNTPAILTASVINAPSTAGTYSGSISITSQGASNTTVTIPVTLTVSSQASLTTSPSSLTFNYTIGGTVPGSQTVNVGSTGTAFTFTAATSTPWLKVTQNGSSTPGTLSVSVNTTGLAAGTLTGTITITAAGASNSPLSYSVTLIVAGQPTLSVGPLSLTFGGQVNGTNPASQSISVASTGGALSFTAAATSTGNWLSVSPAGGTTNATLTASVNITGLAAGTYTGSIVISAPGAFNPSVTVPVTLTLGSNALTVGPTSLSFAYPIASQTLTVGSTNAALSFTAAAGASWLSVTPTNGNTLTTLTVSVKTTGLAAGTYTSAITITAAGASNSPLSVPVTLVVPAIAVNPGSLTFNQVGGTAPAAQNLAITSTSTPLSFTAAAGASWLSILPASGTTPATLAVSVNSSGLAPGTYTSAITITAAGAANSPFTVPVTFTVPVQASIVATPATLAFSYAIGASTPAIQSIAISTSNGTVASFTAVASTLTGGKWLAVSPASGSTPASLMISVIPASLTAGTYTGSVVISAPGFNSQTVNVTLTVTPASPASIVITGTSTITVFNTTAPASTTLGISVSTNAALPYTVTGVGALPSWLTFTPTSGTTPGNLTLTAKANGLYPGTYVATLSVNIPGSTQGTKTIPVQLTVAGSTLIANPVSLSFAFQAGGTAPAAQSLTISPAPGTAPTLGIGAITTTASWLRVTSATSAPATVQVSVSLSLLTPGSYSAEIYVNALGSTGPSLVVPVTLTIGQLPQLTATPATLVFGYTPGGTLPAAQSIALSSGGVPLSFTITSPGAWLAVSPARGTTPDSVLVTANPTGLGAGTYSGTITASAYGAANSVQIPVTLTVSGPGQLQATPAQLSFASPVGGPAPPAQTVSVGAISAVAFSAASNAKWLSVTAAAGTTPASLTISANPAGLLAGTYLGSITLTPTSGSGTPVTIMVTFKVGSGTGTGTPAISAVQNAASGVAGTVAPGLWVSIFGNSLGPVTGVPFVTPPTGETVATMLGGTQVLFDGTAVPLLYVSDAQVNALAPFELVGKTSTVMQVVSNGEVSASVTLPVVPALPGLFTADGSGKGEGAILNQDSSVNSTSNPAAQGSIIVLYGTGGGETNPASIDGAFNPLNADGTLLLPVTVTIGGQSAQVEYAGPAPGLVDGVMQINAKLPGGLASGAVPVIVQVGTVSSQTITVALQ